MTLENYLKGLQLKHFSAKELMFLGGQNEQLGLNSLPEESLWPNVVRTAQIADLARSSLGSSIRILSGYRNKAYNSAIKGASQSQHLSFNALDLGTAEPKKLFDLLFQWRKAKLFLGGLGLYPSFVHIDTRGYNATW